MLPQADSIPQILFVFDDRMILFILGSFIMDTVTYGTVMYTENWQI